MKKALVAVACIAAVAAPGWASAQQFPTKTVRLVSMTTGIADALARMMGERMTAGLGQPVIVDPVLAASGAMAAEQVARSAPDGYTLFVTYPDPLVMRHLLVKNVSYETLKDFTPITVLIDATIGFAVRPGLSATSLKEFIDHAKANPNKLTYGSNGVGSSFQMAAEALKQHAGMAILHVPYKTTTDAQNALLRGEVDFIPAALATGMPLQRAGKLRFIGIVNNHRAPALPDIPSTREVVPGFSSPPFWVGVLGPSRLPAPTLQRLHTEIVQAVRTPEFRKRSEDASFNVVGNTPEEFRKRLEGEVEYMAKTAQAAGIRPE
jgi:tripartite-type tricarboxylate transporter receptor subunit TctC